MQNPQSRNLESKLVDFLIEKKGYPVDALAQEAWIMSRERGIGGTADVAVVDPSMNDYVAFFEVKESAAPEAIDIAAKQLMEYRKIGGVPSVAMYFVTNPASPDYEFSLTQILPDGERKLINPKDLPTFASLIGTVVASENSVRKVLVRERVDRFRYVCFGLAFVVALFLLADIFNWVSLTAKQLTLGAVSIGLILIPFAASFKMLGIEFERYRPEKQSDD